MVLSGRLYWYNDDAIHFWDAATGELTTRIRWHNPPFPKYVNGQNDYYSLGSLTVLPDGRVWQRIDQNQYDHYDDVDDAWVPDSKMALVWDPDITEYTMWTQPEPTNTRNGGLYQPAEESGGVLAPDGESIWVSWSHFTDPDQYDSWGSWTQFDLDGNVLQTIGGPAGTPADSVSGRMSCYTIVDGYLYRTGNDTAEFHRTSLDTGVWEISIPPELNHSYLGTHPTLGHVFFRRPYDNASGGFVTRISAYPVEGWTWHLRGDYGQHEEGYWGHVPPTSVEYDPSDEIEPGEGRLDWAGQNAQAFILSGDEVLFGIQEPYGSYGGGYDTPVYGNSAALVSLNLLTGEKTRIVSFPHMWLNWDGTQAAPSPVKGPEVYGTMDATILGGLAMAAAPLALSGGLTETRRRFRGR